MLINIWATLTYLGDAGFSGTDHPETERLSLAFAEAMRERTHHRQTWMMNAHLAMPGTSLRLWDESYAHIRDAHESYLQVFAPGFTDALYDIPVEQTIAAYRNICRMGRAFNKRTIAFLLGTPPGCPEDAAVAIARHNDALRSLASDDLRLCDLTSLAYTPWSAQGSRPADMREAGRRLAQSVMENHAAAEAWKAQYGT